MRLDKKNPNAEIPSRLEIAIEPKAPLCPVLVGLGVPLLVVLVVVMFTQVALGRIVRLDERVKSMHCVIKEG